LQILVFTHGKSQIKLVFAHTKIGEAYLNYNCVEQAIDHLTLALKKNGKLFSEVKDSKIYHSHILTVLGKCYVEFKIYDDALELLQKAREIQLSVYGEESSENMIPTLELISKCYTKKKDFDTGLEYINKVWDIQEQRHGYKSQEGAMTFVESAKIHALKENYASAIDFQTRAIDMLINLNYDNPQYVAQLY